MDYPKLEELNCNTIREISIKKHYPEFYEMLVNKWTDLSHSERLYCFYNNIENKPVCKECGKPVKFLSIHRGYQQFCSNKCSNKNSEKIEKIISNRDYKEIFCKVKKTKLEKYGDENYNNSESTKITCERLYGGQGNSSEILRQRYKQSCIEKWGVDNPMKNKDICKKQKDIIKEKYGDALNKKIKDSRREFEKGRNPHIIDYTDDNMWVCKCPHIDCNKCIEKKYIIHPSIYAGRKSTGLETCTILNPVNKKQLKNTHSEQFIRHILDENNIEYVTNDRGILGGKELDIYIPNKRIAIECNGVFWHDSEHKSNNYHYNKFNDCVKNDIQLLTIWEDQVWNKPEIVKSIILSKLGVYKNKIYARKCKIKDVSYKDCQIFLEENHIQGKTIGGTRLGLYHNNELVSVMVFGHTRRGIGNENCTELIRFCNKLNTIVIGGASKLFKYYVNNYQPTKIISFSSNDISLGQLYSTLGFEYNSTSKTSYWYIDPKTLQRYHRTNFTKSRLVKEGFDPSKSEYQIMKERGFLKIYDSGQQKWVYEKN